MLSRPLVRNNYPPLPTFRFLVPWIRFVIQKSVVVYWDEIEKLGIKVRQDFYRHDVIEALRGLAYPINRTTLNAQRPKDARFSIVRGNTYLAGPAGLINHACSRHSNCILHFGDWSVEVNVSRLEAGSRVYYTYSDEDDMIANRGFSCTCCR